MTKRPRVGLADFSYTRAGRRKLERKMDLLIWFTWKLSDGSEDRVRNPLGMVCHWLCRAIEVSVHIRTCTILAFQSGKEELPSANFQL